MHAFFYRNLGECGNDSIEGRESAGSAGAADSEKSGARSDARVGYHAPHPTHIERSAARRRRVSLPRSSSHGAGAMDRFNVGAERKQPPGPFLQADGPGTEAVGGGAAELADNHQRYWS